MDTPTTLPTLQSRGRRAAGLVLALGVAFAAAACESPELIVPTAGQVRSYYTSESIVDVQMNGNVAEIFVRQNAAQLRRGGSLWARMGPYIYLFTEPTRDVFRDFNGLAGVRVITRVGSTEVARALLRSDVLNDITWRRALNVNGLARRDGSQRPSLIEDLIDFGEARTDHTYNARYVR